MCGSMEIPVASSKRVTHKEMQRRGTQICRGVVSPKEGVHCRCLQLAFAFARVDFGDGIIGCDGSGASMRHGYDYGSRDGTHNPLEQAQMSGRQAQ